MTVQPGLFDAQLAGPWSNDRKTAREYYIDPTCPKHQTRLRPEFRVVLFRWAPGLDETRLSTC